MTVSYNLKKTINKSLFNIVRMTGLLQVKEILESQVIWRNILLDFKNK